MTLRDIKKELIYLTKLLIQTPSFSGQESDIADILVHKMKEFKYDNVIIDDIGNVIGIIKGENTKAPILFTTHMDHVPPGERAKWFFDPFQGLIDGDYIYGCGAADAKGPLVTQLLIKCILNDIGKHGDILVAFTVGEEVGGFGSRYLVRHLDCLPRFAIVGEPSGNELRNGHRGRAILNILVNGKRTHTSRCLPEENVFFICSHLIMNLFRYEWSRSPAGSTSVIPVSCTNESCPLNVTPSWLALKCDCRVIPNQSPDDIVKILEKLLPNNAVVQIENFTFKSYTGLEFQASFHPPFWISPSHPALLTVQAALEKTFKREFPIKPWQFTTDAGIFAEKGIITFGLAPGEETCVHGANERISISDMLNALAYYRNIVKTLANTKLNKLFYA